MIRYCADYVTYRLIGLTRGSTSGEAANFFVYETAKIFLMLAVIIFAVSVIRSYFPPERTKKILSHKRTFIGNITAALLGVVTPFCSCSAVPVFIGFVEAGVPLGVTFSFLISSPMVNEVALVLLWGMFGWKIALLYVSVGLTVAIFAGIVISRLRLEHLVEEYVYNIRVGSQECRIPVMRERVAGAVYTTREIIGKVWIYILVAIGIGAFIHGYAPQDFLVRFAGKDNIFAVPIAVLLGIPLYSNAAGTIPIVQALVEKGMPLGTALAFMMAVVAISTPEMIILRKVIKPKLIAIFTGVVSLSIILIGYLFNIIL